MLKKIILLSIIALPLAGCTATTPTVTEQEYSYRSISSDEAKKLMDENTGYIIVDVRDQDEYDASHIPDAVCIPNESINDKDEKRLPDKKQLIFVYCQSGVRSKEAAEKLVKLGYTNVIEFGGITDWNGEIFRTKAYYEGDTVYMMTGNDFDFKTFDPDIQSITVISPSVKDNINEQQEKEGKLVLIRDNGRITSLYTDDTTLTITTSDGEDEALVEAVKNNGEKKVYKVEYNCNCG